jgi:hypothetical protein
MGKNLAIFMVTLLIVFGLGFGFCVGPNKAAGEEPYDSPYITEEVTGMVCIMPVGVTFIGVTDFGIMEVTSFEEQYVTIKTKMTDKNDSNKVAYTFDLAGFAHNCPVHGKEVLDTGAGMARPDMFKECHK